MRDRIEQADHYRAKADQARVLAETVKDAQAKRFLRTVANDYLMLADVLERTNLGDMLPASE